MKRAARRTLRVLYAMRTSPLADLPLRTAEALLLVHQSGALLLARPFGLTEAPKETQPSLHNRD